MKVPTHSDLVSRVIERWSDVVDLFPMYLQDNLRDLEFPVSTIQRAMLDGICAVIAADLFALEVEGKL